MRFFKQNGNWRWGNRIKILGYLDNPEDLRRFCCGCRFFVFPSLFEGFGFPPLEAMSCGIPVICSNSGALPEVVGEGGLLLHPEDAPAWEEALASWWNAENLSEWKNKAQHRAEAFSWSRTAEQTLEVYRRVAENAE